MEPIKFTSRRDGCQYEIVFCKDSYANNNRLYIGCNCSDGEPYCDITVNLTQDNIPEGNYGFLDTNNGERDLFDLMFEKGWMENTGDFAMSGFCIYPLVKFSDEFLEMIENEMTIENEIDQE